MNPTPPPSGDALELTPPLPPFPPPLWERPLFWIALVILLALLAGLVVAVVAIRRRLNRPPSPATLANTALAGEPGPAVVTRALRDYLAARVPALRTGLTTAEIADALPTPGWAPLLRECDDARFAGLPAFPDLGTRARALVADTERELAKPASGR